MLLKKVEEMHLLPTLLRNMRFVVIQKAEEALMGVT